MISAALGIVFARFLFVFYNPCKDMFSCIGGRKQDIEDLSGNLRDLLTQIMTIQSRMKNLIDPALDSSGSKEKTDEYKLLETNIELFKQDFTIITQKCRKLNVNIPSSAGGAADLDDIETVKKLLKELHKIKPKIRTRKFSDVAKLSRDVVKLKDRVSKIVEGINKDNMIMEMRREEIQLDGANIHIPIQSEYVKRIENYLHDPTSKFIGLVGPVGVGKSIVLGKLKNRLLDGTILFDGEQIEHVVHIVLPKEINDNALIIEKIQDGVMEQLDPGQGKPSNTSRISRVGELLRNKRYVVLIDQVFVAVDLREVGFPEKNKYGKVVFASRNKKVTNQMSDRRVEIGTLLADEALEFFRNVYGEIEHKRKHIANSIIKSCGGLPLVIKLVAEHLKEPGSSWEDTNRVLQEDTKNLDLLGLQGVGRVYMLEYNKLLDKEEDNRKKCALYGALFPSDNSIHKDYLIECWIAEGFIKIENTKKQLDARERGAAVLNYLTNKYLLQWCSDKHVKMPLYGRQVALKQGYPGEKSGLVLAPPHSSDGLTEEMWKNATRISAISSNLKLPTKPRSNKMCTLLLQRKPDLVTIGDSFFTHMGALRVLDFYETRIERLPKSIGALRNLVSLYLNGCSRLKKLPEEIKCLVKLELLDIRGTSIPRLPKEIGNMPSLKCLRVSFDQIKCDCDSERHNTDAMIPIEIIDGLKQLEEFTIETGCCDKGWIDTASRVCGGELANLEQLTTLGFHFATVSSFNKTFTTRKTRENATLRCFRKSKQELREDESVHRKINEFRSFKISIGFSNPEHPHGSDISGTEKQLRLHREDSSSSDNDLTLVKQVLKQAEAFELVGRAGVQTLNDFGFENTEFLEVLIVECCNGLERIGEETTTTVFQSLKKLHLYNLDSLKCIWEGPISPESFPNLEILTICGCPELTKITNHDLTKALSSLKHVKVKNCAKLVEIFSEEPEQVQCREIVSEGQVDALHKLETIELVNLPELQSICATTSIINLVSLRKVTIRSCNKLRKLSSILTSAKEKIEAIKCEASWWDALELSEEEKQHFRPRCEFIAMEGKPSSINASPEGERSCVERPVNREGPDVINGGNTPKDDVMPSNGVSTQLSTSNTNDPAKTEMQLPLSEERLPKVDLSISTHSKNFCHQLPRGGREKVSAG
ncbi:hypothetical protein ACP275_07G105300 [Erythranthe tilingii]